MFLTIVGYIMLALVMLLAALVMLIITTEMFIYASYNYQKSEYALAAEIKLLRRWRMYRQDVASSVAKTVLEDSAAIIAREEQPEISAIVRKYVEPRAALKVEKEIEAEPSGIETVAIAMPPEEFLTVAAHEDAAADAVETVVESKTERKKVFFQRFKEAFTAEIKTRPGRNVVLALSAIWDVKRLAFYIIRSCYRSFSIRSMTVNCRFGAEDPFDTGQAAGVVYTTLNAMNFLRRHKRITVRFVPDFEKQSFEFDADTVIMVKATVVALKIIGAIFGALLKGVFYYGGKIAWRLGSNHFGKPQKSGVN